MYKDISRLTEIFGADYMLKAIQNYLSADEWNDFIDSFERENDLDYEDDE